MVAAITTISSREPASAAVSTNVTLNFTESDGVTPMATANVGVYYTPPADTDLPDGSTFTMTQLGAGTTNASGQWSGALNSSSIATSALADIGDGVPDAFNVGYEAIDAQGNFAFDVGVLTLGSNASTSITASETSAGTAGLVAAPLSGESVVLAHKWRYTPVTPLNSGYGIQAVLTFTTSSTTTRQTEVNAVKVSSAGGLSVGAQQMEEKSRQVVSPLKENGSYNTWVWEQYEFKEYRICGQNCGGGTAAVWRPYQATGNVITANNTDTDKNSNTIGVSGYGQPSFTPGSQGQYYFVLTQSNSGWARSSGTREGNDVNASFTIPGGGGVTVDSLTTYGSITSVQYNWISSSDCGPGNSRVIWGHNATVGGAFRIQANCFSNSMLP